MKNTELAIAAIKEEAKQKPDEKVRISKEGLITYAELAERVSDNNKAIKLFVKNYVKRLKEDKEFRAGIMSMLGLE